MLACDAANWMLAAVMTAEKKECGVYNLSKAWAVAAILRQPVNPPAQPRDAWTTSMVSVAIISPNLATPCSDSIPEYAATLQTIYLNFT